VSERIEIVNAFIEAFNAHALDRIMAFFADDAVYHNLPIEPVSGHAAIRQVLEGFMGQAAEVDWVTYRSAESGDGVVLNERLDRFRLGEQWLELPVMGSFEVEGRRIRAWRDYFDIGQFQRQMAAIQGASS